ncbi:MAG: hypothetical protein LBS21_00810 [Clostridiales bacterium]|jgi:hypothetical protein|nr:hypothetical protein [Clostridiales bacterium]
MRKQQLTQINEIISTFGELLNAITDKKGIIPLLALLQENIAPLIDFISESYGKNSQTEELLFEFYNQIGEAATDSNFGAPHIKILRESLNKIEGCVKSELKADKIEVVFLCHSAAMSDSLESIWQAAMDDPMCDAYVIPIPYFDHRADITIKDMKCDTQESYPNVKITDWRTYDFEKRRPDAIYSCAPYDEGNFVINVHPNFYFKRLRKLTDMLVYVPYFVVGSSPVGEHLCVTPAALYADRVFVESESVKQQYINHIRNYEEKNNCIGVFGDLDKKIVALGSPKYDKVVSTKRENCEIPDEWREIIGNRKVVLYNTTIGAALAGNEKYLKKLRHVLEFFRNRSDVALWWRPHPFAMSTYENMRPHLADEYKAIVEEYRNHS